MTLVTLRRPAHIADLADMLPGPLATGKVGPYELAARYQKLTRSWAAVAQGRCLACGGLYAHADGSLEAWFACRPEAAEALLSIARQARLTLRLIADAERVPIFARVAKGWEPCRRLARAVGLFLWDGDGAVERWGLCPT